ncbi:hypothetical protein M514_24225 [Trichuris suis]|uniref:Uncharacterized protein n=1 Tax=Trichuris suis TaxID=68888 RepID=A0A085N2A3_9BILA|nr:hypothetical protein M514_24225 [Trichuris suis]
MPAEAPTTSPDIVGHNDRRLTTERKDQVPVGGHEITAQRDSAVLDFQARETKAGGGVSAILLPSKSMINGLPAAQMLVNGAHPICQQCAMCCIVSHIFVVAKARIKR